MTCLIDFQWRVAATIVFQYIEFELIPSTRASGTNLWKTRSACRGGLLSLVCGRHGKLRHVGGGTIDAEAADLRGSSGGASTPRRSLTLGDLQRRPLRSTPLPG